MSAEFVVGKFRKRSWHGIELNQEGYEFIKDGESPVEAMQSIGLYDQKYTMAELYASVGGVYVPTGKAVPAFSNWGNPVLLKKVSTRYDPLQPADLANITAPLSKSMQLEGVGLLGERAGTLFVQFNMPSYSVAGDEHLAYMLAGQDIEGGGLYLGLVNTRVVCMNTWGAAIATLSAIGHKDPHVWLKLATDMAQRATEAQQAEQAFLEIMTGKKLEDVNGLVKAVYPDPAMPKKLQLLDEARQMNADVTEAEASASTAQILFENAIQRTDARRQDLANRFFAYAEDYGRTGYSAWCAVTEQVRPSENNAGYRVPGTAQAVASTIFPGGVRYAPVAAAKEYLTQM